MSLFSCLLFDLVCCYLSLFVFCHCLSFVIVGRLSLFGVCRCLMFFVVCRLSSSVVCCCLLFVVVCCFFVVFSCLSFATFVRQLSKARYISLFSFLVIVRPAVRWRESLISRSRVAAVLLISLRKVSCLLLHLLNLLNLLNVKRHNFVWDLSQSRTGCLQTLFNERLK